LRDVGLLKYYEEATSLKGNSGLLVHLIHQWNVHRQYFCVGPDQWYHPTEEDIYFIIGLSRRGDDFPQFPYLLVGVVVESHLMYSQRYIGFGVLSPTNCQVFGGQLKIASFGAEEVRFLSLLVTNISHLPVMGSTLDALFCIMLIHWYNDHGVSDGLPFFCGSFV
jgi:hypothetical protein